MMDLPTLEARQERYLDRRLAPGPLLPVREEDKPPPFASAKEIEILSSLTRLRFATVEHMSTITGRKIRRVQETMESLRSKRLVAWFRWVDLEGTQNGMDPLTTIRVYCLTTKGVERCILNRVIETDENMVVRKWRGKPVVHSFIPHQMVLVEIILCLEMASKESSNHKMVWSVPDFVKEKIGNKLLSCARENATDDKNIIPDIVTCFKNVKTQEVFTCYIEYERRSKKPKEITKKFENYTKIFRKISRRFNQGKPLLLYVVNSAEEEKYDTKRMKNVRDLVCKYDVKNAFRITTINKLKKDAFGPIWQKADGSVWSIEK